MPTANLKWIIFTEHKISFIKTEMDIFYLLIAPGVGDIAGNKQSSCSHGAGILGVKLGREEQVISN